MATNSNIEWTHHTFNLWWGCVRVHAGCDNCYAAALANRWGKNLWDNDVREYKKQGWKDLPKWQKAAKESGEMHRVFVGSMMDVFEKPMRVIDSKGQDMGITTGDLRGRLFDEIDTDKYPNLIFLFLTKRPSNIRKYIPDHWLENPPSNVMFGATVVDQKSVLSVARSLNKVKGRKFLSVEPLLEQINLNPFTMINPSWQLQVDWVIVGGESGPKRRPFDPDWARDIRSQVDLSRDVAFFMKQWDKVKTIPGDLMIREFPRYHQVTPISQPQ